MTKTNVNIITTRICILTKLLCLLLIPKWAKKTTKIIDINLKMRFLGVVSHLELPNSTIRFSMKTMRRIDTFFGSKKQTQILTLLDLAWHYPEPKLAESCVRELYWARHWSMRRKWFIEHVLHASTSPFLCIMTIGDLTWPWPWHSYAISGARLYTSVL